MQEVLATKGESREDDFQKTFARQKRKRREAAEKAANMKGGRRKKGYAIAGDRSCILGDSQRRVGERGGTDGVEDCDAS